MATQARAEQASACEVRARREVGVERYEPGMACLHCGGEVLSLLGFLGKMAWFRCVSCGMQRAAKAAEVAGVEFVAIGEWESTEW